MMYVCTRTLSNVTACNNCNKEVTLRLPVIGCAIEGGFAVHIRTVVWFCLPG